MLNFPSEARPLMFSDSRNESTNFSMHNSYMSLFKDVVNLENIGLFLPDKGVTLTDTAFYRLDTIFVLRFRHKASSIKFKIKDISNIVSYVKEWDDLRLLSYVYNDNYGTEENITLISDSKKTIVQLSISSEEEDFESDQTPNHYVEIHSINPEVLQTIFNVLEELKITKKPKSSPIYIFERDSQGGMFLTPHTLQKFDLDIEKHYNDDFADKHKRIQEWCENLDSINKKLVLLSGTPGTGKTNYIKNLIASQTSRRVIYIPPYQVGAIADPQFFSFISKYKNALLIVEDAERVLISREDNSGNEAVSLMLNMTDGILASALNFKIICTFNTDESKIDEALMRNGRLFLKYKFGELDADKTFQLYQELYDEEPPKNRMTLAEIYENDENGYAKKETKRIGFGV